MFLINLNRKNKRLYKNWCTYKNICQSNQNHLKAFIRYLKDLKNKPEFEKFYFKYASNNSSIIRGCNLGLIKNNHRLY